MRTLVCLSLFLMSSAQAETNVAFPPDYRQWTHVKSMLIEPGHALYEAFGGLHHLYANATAMQGYRRGGTFPEGSVIAFDLLAAQSGGHSVIEGERKVLGLMKKDSKRFVETGGWGFEAYAGGDPKKPLVGDKAAQACYACHTAREQNDFVFSSWRD